MDAKKLDHWLAHQAKWWRLLRLLLIIVLVAATVAILVAVLFAAGILTTPSPRTSDSPAPISLCPQGYGGRPLPGDEGRLEISAEFKNVNGSLIWVETNVDPALPSDFTLVGYARQSGPRGVWTKLSGPFPSAIQADPLRWWLFVDLPHKPDWEEMRDRSRNCSPSVTWSASGTLLKVLLLPNTFPAPQHLNRETCAEAIDRAPYHPGLEPPADDPCGQIPLAQRPGGAPSLAVQRYAPAVSGTVRAVDPSAYEVRAFVMVPDLPATGACKNAKGWYPKPLAERWTVRPAKNGRWAAGIFSGPDDDRATHVAAFLVPPGTAIRPPDGETDAWFQAGICDKAVAATIEPLPELRSGAGSP